MKRLQCFAETCAFILACAIIGLLWDANHAQAEEMPPVTQQMLEGWLRYWQPRFGNALNGWEISIRFGSCKEMTGGCRKSVAGVTWTHAGPLGRAKILILATNAYAEAYPDSPMSSTGIAAGQYDSVVHELLHLVVSSKGKLDKKTEETMVESVAEALISGDGK